MYRWTEPPPKGSWVIVVPVLECMHPRTADDVLCPRLVLPHPNLRAFQLGLEETPEEYIRQAEWPADEWSAFVGCSTCGQVSSYEQSGVDFDLREVDGPGLYNANADCFCIEFRCGRKNCGALTKLHVTKERAIEADIANIFRGPFFLGSLPCGHEFHAVPPTEYKIYKVTDRIE
jgi:hypothetical protein